MHQSIIVCVLSIKALPNPRSQCQDFIWSLLKRERDPVVRQWDSLSWLLTNIDFCLVLIDVLKLSWPGLSSHCIATQKAPGMEEQGKRRWVDIDIRKRSLTKRRSNKAIKGELWCAMRGCCCDSKMMSPSHIYLDKEIFSLTHVAGIAEGKAMDTGKEIYMGWFYSRDTQLIIL